MILDSCEDFEIFWSNSHLSEYENTMILFMYLFIFPEVLFGGQNN